MFAPNQELPLKRALKDSKSSLLPRAPTLLASRPGLGPCNTDAAPKMQRVLEINESIAKLNASLFELEEQAAVTARQAMVMKSIGTSTAVMSAAPKGLEGLGM
jgi:hypothetical protein